MNMYSSLHSYTYACLHIYRDDFCAFSVLRLKDTLKICDCPIYIVESTFSRFCTMGLNCLPDCCEKITYEIASNLEIHVPFD